MTADVWIRNYPADVPPTLLEAMLQAVGDSDSESVPEALAGAAVRMFGTVVRGQGGREDAFPLLVADALFTHAFEAQAEIDPEGVAGFAARWRSALVEIPR